MILVIDNYDSFTYNLVQYVGEHTESIRVVRNDAVSLATLAEWPITKIIISPGPGRPHDAGISMDVIRHFYKQTPILGVCLGHQAIGEVFGGIITYAPTIMHGKASPIFHDGKGLYDGLPSPFDGGRYHSLVIDRITFPSTELTITSWLDDGTIMGVQHHNYPVIGIQFHPESLLTDHGKQIIKNFIDYV
jgi:anthranilate synthase/aminodeoxychorismate synthase-like glutamine amidotransferase